jgi:serine/threonine protein kinase
MSHIHIHMYVFFLMFSGTFEIPDDIGQAAKDLIRQLLCVDVTQRITAHTALQHPWLAKHQAETVDMNQLRFDTTILISNKAEDDIDDETIAEMALFGYQKEEIIRIISSKIHSSAATLYYLLLNHVVKKRIPLGGCKRAVCMSVPSTHPQYIPSYGGAGVSGSKSSTYRQNVPSGRPIPAVTAIPAKGQYTYDGSGAPAPVQSSYAYALRLQTGSHNG